MLTSVTFIRQQRGFSYPIDQFIVDTACAANFLVFSGSKQKIYPVHKPNVTIANIMAQS